MAHAPQLGGVMGRQSFTPKTLREGDNEEALNSFSFV